MGILNVRSPEDIPRNRQQVSNLRRSILGKIYNDITELLDMCITQNANKKLPLYET